MEYLHGERTKIYLNLDSSLPSNYDIRISGSSTGSGAGKLGRGQQKWYSYSTPTKTGSAKIYFHLFKDGNHVVYLNKSSTFPIVNPTVSSVSIPTLTKDVKSKIKIYGNNFTTNMAFTIYDAVCDNGRVTKSSSTYGYIYCTPRASGNKSWVVKDKSGGTALKNGTVIVNNPSNRNKHDTNNSNQRCKHNLYCVR